ncbi:hypothetical protein ACFSTA_19120 [Ornithinibacillus salinisoli]|uniref:TOTE conflict system primase domain-containing protein n=1 Tax=Ornithinibacillus salinisoli TaxID=1848459 RepID=A0ABW4W3Z9_9BACI
MNNLKEIINKINELYIIKRSKYLVLNNKGNYITTDTSKGGKAFPLNDYIVQRHLEGKATFGVFSTKRASKFICFDVDVKDDLKAKWTTYKVVHSLTEIGVPDNYIHISHSGNKGYHVEIFFNQPIENYLLKEFYTRVLNNADLLDIDYGAVEFRPTANQGVKLPLGRHFKTKGNKRCWYVNYDKRLEPVRSYNYILKIEQMDSRVIYDILVREKDILLEEDVIEVDKAEEYIEQKYKPLPIYKQNIDKEETVEQIENILTNGLSMTGTRNNSLFKLAKYFKWKGLSREQTKQELLNWMKWQDTRLYTSKWDICLKDIEHISTYVFANDVQLTVEKSEVVITYNEILQVIQTCKSKNEKLLAYCMLIHSKRYSNQSGVFYMTFEQMAKASGLAEKTTRRLIKKLVEINAIDIVERNQKQEGTHKKKPNKYKVNIKEEKENKQIFTIDIENENYSATFSDCVIYLIERKVLKVMLPRRQYESIVV